MFPILWIISWSEEVWHFVGGIWGHKSCRSIYLFTFEKTFIMASDLIKTSLLNEIVGNNNNKKAK